MPRRSRKSRAVKENHQKRTEKVMGNTLDDVSGWMWGVLNEKETKLRRKEREVKCRLERMKKRTVLAGKGDQSNTPTNHIVPAKEKSHSIRVPSWRQRTISASSIDNTGEEMTDEAFDRRHSKLEVDERKRKRWDFQRIRELREHEKLERNARRKELGVWENTLTTFCPDSAEVRRVQVEDTVPVVAFGAHVPVCESKVFDVPWFDAKSRETADTMRKSRKRACKK